MANGWSSIGGMWRLFAVATHSSADDDAQQMIGIVAIRRSNIFLNQGFLFEFQSMESSWLSSHLVATSLSTKQSRLHHGFGWKQMTQEGLNFLTRSLWSTIARQSMWHSFHFTASMQHWHLKRKSDQIAQIRMQIHHIQCNQFRCCQKWDARKWVEKQLEKNQFLYGKCTTGHQNWCSRDASQEHYGPQQIGNQVIGRSLSMLANGSHMVQS